MAELPEKVRNIRSVLFASRMLLFVTGLKLTILFNVFSPCVNVEICCATGALQSCSTKLSDGMAFVEFSFFL